MSSDGDFFRRLFESPPDTRSDDPKDRNFNIEYFAEWLHEQNEDEDIKKPTDKKKGKPKRKKN